MFNPVKALIINNVEFPAKYNGYTVSRNKIWSKNTGRNNNGNMVGTIITIKTKAEIELAPITPAKAKIIDSIVSNINDPFPTAKLLYLDGTQKTVIIYTGDISYPFLSSTLNDEGLIVGTKLSVIEK